MVRSWRGFAGATAALAAPALFGAARAFAQATPPTANVENVIGQMLVLIRDGSKRLSERMAELFVATAELDAQIDRVIALMTDLNGLPVLWAALPKMIGMWAIAGLVEWLLRRRIGSARYWASAAAQTDIGRHWLRRGAAFGLELVSFAVFFFATVILSFVFFELGDPLRVLPVVLSLVRAIVQGFWTIGRLLASPRPWLYCAVGGLGVGGIVLSGMLMLYGLKAELATLLELACGTLAIGLIFVAMAARAWRQTASSCSSRRNRRASWSSATTRSSSA